MENPFFILLQSDAMRKLIHKTFIAAAVTTYSSILEIDISTGIYIYIYIYIYI